MIAMKEAPDNYWDLAIVDPPYGIGNFVQITGNKRGEPVTWNNEIPPPKYFTELIRVSKNQIIWGANYFNCFPELGGSIVWNKRVHPKTNFSICEIASCSFHKRVNYIDLIWQNINNKII